MTNYSTQFPRFTAAVLVSIAMAGCAGFDDAGGSTATNGGGPTDPTPNDNTPFDPPTLDSAAPKAAVIIRTLGGDVGTQGKTVTSLGDGLGGTSPTLGDVLKTSGTTVSSVGGLVTTVAGQIEQTNNSNLVRSVTNSYSRLIVPLINTAQSLATGPSTGRNSDTGVNGLLAPLTAAATGLASGAGGLVTPLTSAPAGAAGVGGLITSLTSAPAGAGGLITALTSAPAATTGPATGTGGATGLGGALGTVTNVIAGAGGLLR